MDPLTVGLIVVSCSLGSYAAAALVARRRKRATAKAAKAQQGAEANGASDEPPAAEAESDPTDGLSLRIGDVVQHGNATRWPRGALLIHQGGRLHCALLLSSEDGTQQAVVSFVPPERHILWLIEVQLAMPPSPPGRIEIDGRLLDREALFPALVSTHGEATPTLDGNAMFALYDGSVGDAAVVLQGGDRTLVYYGRRLHPDDYDRLGTVDE